jgi:hypothetical protein
LFSSFQQNFSQSPPDHSHHQQPANLDQFQPVNPSQIFRQKQTRGLPELKTFKTETETSFSPSVTSPTTTGNSTPSSNASHSCMSTTFIEAPPGVIKGPFLIQCSLCKNLSTDETNFYDHLTEVHFQNELLKELPQIPPFKCPVDRCAWDCIGKPLSSLLRHYGADHKAFTRYLHGQVVGR